MFWLVIQMWFLLFVAFAIGIGAGVWLSHSRVPANDQTSDTNQKAKSDSAATMDGDLSNTGQPAGQQTPIYPNIRRRPNGGPNGPTTPLVTPAMIVPTPTRLQPMERPNLRANGGDDLTEIIGVDSATMKRLHSLGIRSFEQIADWNSENAAWVDDQLDDKGRVSRERWVEQASGLAQ